MMSAAGRLTTHVNAAADEVYLKTSCNAIQVGSEDNGRLLRGQLTPSINLFPIHATLRVSQFQNCKLLFVKDNYAYLNKTKNDFKKMGDDARKPQARRTPVNMCHWSIGPPEIPEFVNLDFPGVITKKLYKF